MPLSHSHRTSGFPAEPGANQVGFPPRRRSGRAEPEEITGHVEDGRQTHLDRRGALAAYRIARKRAPDHAEPALGWLAIEALNHREWPHRIPSKSRCSGRACSPPKLLHARDMIAPGRSEEAEEIRCEISRIVSELPSRSTASTADGRSSMDSSPMPDAGL